MQMSACNGVLDNGNCVCRLPCTKLLKKKKKEKLAQIQEWNFSLQKKKNLFRKSTKETHNNCSRLSPQEENVTFT